MKLPPDRPADLPNFDKPPLDEVVLGIQFAPLMGYQQIKCGEVWALFKDKYPRVEEQMPLAPSFEIFGGPPMQATTQFNLIDRPVHDRFWFLDESGNQLIQFQPDRLLHNWRKVGNEGTYPHFESMITAFDEEIGRLASYAAALEPQKLSINQCEISYINRIDIESASEASLSTWLALWKADTSESESVGFSIRNVLRRENGAPYARMMIECGSGISPAGKPALGLTLTVRGAPTDPTIESAIEFLIDGRNTIVRKFGEITTSYAHTKWGMKHV